MARTVVFLHGLESGPGGGKHVRLARLYERVECVDMDMGVMHLGRRNAIARNALWGLVSTWPWRALRYGVEESLKGCLEAQRGTLAAHTRDPATVLVGSSWGGAVATLALANGHWTGRTLLLAPAYAAAVGRFGEHTAPFAVKAVYSRIAALSDAQKKATLIVHGTADTTVPVEHSRELAACTGIRLVELEGETHFLNKAMFTRAPPPPTSGIGGGPAQQQPLLVEAWIASLFAPQHPDG